MFDNPTIKEENWQERSAGSVDPAHTLKKHVLTSDAIFAISKGT